MSAFQAIIYSIVHGFAQFLPVSAQAHHWAVAYFLEWPAPGGHFAGALYLGSLLGLLVYFRHDWASILSSFIQVLLFRKKPMTLDERMVFFIAIASLPIAGLAAYLGDQPLVHPDLGPLLIAGALLVFNLPLWMGERLNRRNKGMFDWNWLDSLIVGFAQCLYFVPGGGRNAGALAAASFRNFNRDAAVKFAYLTLLPLLIVNTATGLKGLTLSGDTAQLGWLNFSLTVIVTFLASLLCISAFMKHIGRKGYGGYMLYRTILAAGILAVHFILRT